MKKKSIVTIILSLVLLLNFITVKPSFASEDIVNNDLVSFEEYVSLMKEAWQKYGVGLEIVNDNTYIPISRNILETILCDIEKSGKALVRTNTETNNKYKRLLEQSINEESNSKVNPNQLMPVTLRHSGEEEIFGDLHIVANSVVIKYSATTRYDAAKEEYLDVTPGRWYESRARNLEDIDYDEQSWSMINGRKSVLAYSSGIATFVYNDPWTNQKWESTVPFSTLETFTGPSDAD